MIVFRRLRGGSVAPATLAPPEASPRRVSGHRQAAHTPSGGREKRPFGRPCGFLRSRRAALVMDRHHGGPRSWPKNPQGRQMCHPPMKVSTGGAPRKPRFPCLPMTPSRKMADAIGRVGF